MQYKLWRYLCALWPQTKIQATGEVVAVILAGVSLAGITLPHWLGWVLLAGIFLFASYNAWLAERRSAESARVEADGRIDAEKQRSTQAAEIARVELAQSKLEQNRLLEDLRVAQSEVAEKQRIIDEKPWTPIRTRNELDRLLGNGNRILNDLKSGDVSQVPNYTAWEAELTGFINQRLSTIEGDLIREGIYPKLRDKIGMVELATACMSAPQIIWQDQSALNAVWDLMRKLERMNRLRSLIVG